MTVQQMVGRMKVCRKDHMSRCLYHMTCCYDNAIHSLPQLSHCQWACLPPKAPDYSPRPPDPLLFARLMFWIVNDVVIPTIKVGVAVVLGNHPKIIRVNALIYCGKKERGIY